VIPIRVPLVFRCDSIDCRKPLNNPAIISAIDGRVFCNSICAAQDYLRQKFGDEPHLVPDDVPLRRLPNRGA
jgi:hypothetical protein